MATKATVKKPSGSVKKTTPLSRRQRITARLTGWWQEMNERRQAFMARRPHRSLRRTRRRDYVRSLAMPGYWSFTNHVRQVMWQQRRLFLWAIVVYSLFSIFLSGMSSQAMYTELSQELRSASSELADGNWSELSQAGILLLGGVTGAVSSAPTEAQQVYAVLLTLLLWLTVVWLLRACLAGRSPRFRDGLYNAGAPIIPTALLVLVGLLQLIPVALAVVGYSVAAVSGLFAGGVEAMVFWLAAGLLLVLSLYWLTSTFIALVVITLPGMRPIKALKIAGDLVIGRRLRVLLRLLWLGLMLALAWLVVMVPLILLDAWIKGLLPAIEWLPVVPLGMVVMSSVSVAAAATYVYLLYRRIVDDESAPA